MLISIKRNKFKPPSSAATLTGRVWLTASPRGCILLLSEGAWNRLRGDLLSGAWPPESSPEERTLLKRIIVGNGSESAVTPKGNLRIPLHLLDMAGIRSKLAWREQERWIELWRPSRFASR